jgi:hypothetical protein
LRTSTPRWKKSRTNRQPANSFVVRRDALGEPAQIRRRPRDDRERDKFGYIVAMQPLDFGLQRGQVPDGGFDQQQEFARLLNLALPSIDGLHRSFQHVDAGGQPLRDDLARDSPGLSPRTTCDQNYYVLRRTFCRHRSFRHCEPHAS